MPVIINTRTQHPFLPCKGDHTAIDLYRAAHQDVRPLQILMINLMADKIGTERQITRLLGDTEIQVQMTFAATQRYIDEIKAGRVSQNTPRDHIEKFYSSFADIKDRKFDGLVITGVNARQRDIQNEDIWSEIVEILDWSKTNVTSSIFLCWAAQAALKYFYDIDRKRRAQKAYGLFDFDIRSDKTGLLSGFADQFYVPVSSWNKVSIEDTASIDKLETLSVNEVAGVGIACEPRAYDDGKHHYPRRVFVLNHPEYETETLDHEYKRDSANDTQWPLPHNYYVGDDMSRLPLNTWRHTGRLYANWVRAVYNATPYDISQILKPYKRKPK